MTQLALLPPDIQALERERQVLARRLGYLSPNSRRARALRSRQQHLTMRLLKLEAQLVTQTQGEITPTSLGPGHAEAFARKYWWDEL